MIPRGKDCPSSVFLTNHLGGGNNYVGHTYTLHLITFLFPAHFYSLAMSSSYSSSSDSEGDFTSRLGKVSTVQMMRDIARLNELKEKGLLSDELLAEMLKCILRGTTGLATKRKHSKIKKALKAKKPRRPASPTTKMIRQIVEKPLLKRLFFFFCMLG